MEKLSEALPDLTKPVRANPEKQAYLRNCYAKTYQHERFYLIERIEKEELVLCQKAEDKLQRILLPRDWRELVNHNRRNNTKDIFNWPGWNESKGKDEGIGLPAVENLRGIISGLIDRSNFNEGEPFNANSKSKDGSDYDIHNWHVIDNILFGNRQHINYKHTLSEQNKASNQI